MNPLSSLPENCDEPAWDRLLQQCADGELDDVAERELLAKLEFQPAGWRTLALAFVEGRLMRRACGEWLRNTVGPPSMVAQSRPQPVWWRKGTNVATAALVVLTAFAAGRWSAPLPESPPTTPTVAVQTPTVHPAAVPEAPSQAETEGPHSAEQRRKEMGSSRAASEIPESAPTPMTYVGLLLPGSDEAIEVPIYRAPPSLEEWRPFEQPLLTPEEEAALRQAGYNVEWERELLTLTSTEGEPILLPLESVRVELSRY